MHMLKGLLILLSEWARGSTILAGTAVRPADPVPIGPRVVRKRVDCPTWPLSRRWSA
jgi:hypothetical protein